MRITQKELNKSVRQKTDTSLLNIVTTSYGKNGQPIQSSILDDIYAQKSIRGNNQHYYIRYTSHNVPSNPHLTDKQKGKTHIIKSNALDDRLILVTSKVFNFYIEFLQSQDIRVLERIRKEAYVRYN